MKKNTFIPFMLLCCLPLFSMGQSVLSIHITGNDAKCNGSAGGSAVVTPSGGFPPYSYVWAPAVSTGNSAIGLNAGTYSVTVTDNNGNTVSGSVTISQPPPLTVIIDSIVVMPCNRTTSGGSCGCSNTLWAVVSGGVPPYSYLWNPGGQTGDTVENACYLEWTVNVTDNNSCVTSDSLNVVIPDKGINIITSGVNKLNNITGVTVYPNPAGNLLNIGINPPYAGNLGIEVFDIVGRKAYDRKPSASNSLITIDVSGIAGGNYLLRITGGDGSQKVVPFSITR